MTFIIPIFMTFMYGIMLCPPQAGTAAQRDAVFAEALSRSGTALLWVFNREEVVQRKARQKIPLHKTCLIRAVTRPILL